MPRPLILGAVATLVFGCVVIAFFSCLVPCFVFLELRVGLMMDSIASDLFLLAKHGEQDSRPVAVSCLLVGSDGRAPSGLSTVIII